VQRSSSLEDQLKGVVVAPQPAAVETGAAVLESGGTAFDAAIATGFVQMVVDPFMCGLGGWGAATLHIADERRMEHVGFWPRIGSLMSPDMWVDDIEGYTDIWRFALFADRRNMIGYRSIMTPGTVAGFDSIHRRHGTRPLAELLAPAIEAQQNRLSDARVRHQPGSPTGASRAPPSA
jgi:gamma-glutamyltranspeptidase / glutathione hydrolase